MTGQQTASHIPSPLPSHAARPAEVRERIGWPQEGSLSSGELVAKTPMLQR